MMIMGEAYDILAVATGIADALGDGWSAEAGHWRSVANDRHDIADAWLIGPDDVALHVTTGGYQVGERVRVSGSLPREWFDHSPSKYSDGPHDPGDITMTRRKSPEAMAREIGRRLLPGWLAYFAATRDRKAAHDAHDADVAAFGDRLVSITGGRWEWSRHECGRHGRDDDPATFPGRSSFTVGRYGDGPVRADVRVTGDGGRVELDITDRDTLASLAEWVAAQRAGGAR